ncbi:MAG: type II toxin-antitoxin system HicB family antitoxin [Bryobacteraceae bacterium]|nr:type II toxin-antitoxin system HicB family antitoxin [Bryobacteraceae bacterium]
MTLRVVLIKSEEGYAVSCPALLGCLSQGESRQEALDNIRVAIREWFGIEGSEPVPEVAEA